MICETPYTEERIRATNLAFDYRWDNRDRNAFMGNTISSSIIGSVKDLAQECINNGSPAEKYIFTFNEKLLNEIGDHQISTWGGVCEWFDEDEIELTEKLDTMTVTDNSIAFDSNDLRINKKSLRGKSRMIVSERDFGTFDFNCRIEN